EELLDGRIARILDPAAIERAVVAEHDRRRRLETLDQQPRLVPDRNRQWAERARHALPAQPILGRGDQRPRAVLILGLEQPPIAGAGAHALFGGLRERKFVDMGRDAADRAAVPPGEEELRLAMLEPRILARREQAVNLSLQWRHPRRIAAVEAKGKLDELAQVVLVLDRMDGDRTFVMRAHIGFLKSQPYICRDALGHRNGAG